MEIFVVISSWIITFVIGCWLVLIWKKHKARQQQEQLAEERIKLQAENQLKSAEREKRWQEQRQKHQAEMEEQCSTLEGFLLARENLYNQALQHIDAHIALSKSRLSPDNRNKQILWESVELVLSSKNIKTIEGRIKDIHRCTLYLRDLTPLTNPDLRLLATHYYLARIQVLSDKITGYKTQAAKHKAEEKIKALFQEALQDEMVYRKAIFECYQKYYQ